MALDKTIIIKDRSGGSYITLVLDYPQMRAQAEDLKDLVGTFSFQSLGHKFPRVGEIAKSLMDQYTDMLAAYHVVWTKVKPIAKPSSGQPFGITPSKGLGTFVWESSLMPAEILPLLEPLERQGFLVVPD